MWCSGFLDNKESALFFFTTGKEFSFKLPHMVVDRIQFLTGYWPHWPTSSLTECQGPCSVPRHKGFSVGQLTTWQLAFLRASKRDSKTGSAPQTETTALDHQTSEGSSYYMCRTSFIRSEALSWGHQGTNTWKWELRKASLEPHLLSSRWYRHLNK